MIRRDKTHYNANKDANNWTNRTFQDDEMTNHDEAVQAEMMKALERKVERAQHGLMTKSELADWELEQRISAATESDNLTGRVEQARKEAVAANRFDDLVRGNMPSGQSEEEFTQEMQDAQARYHRFAVQARKSAGLE